MSQNVMSGVLCLLLLVGCKTASHEGSKTSEGWDRQNNPDAFDAKPLTYDELMKREFQAGSLPFQPWSDDYWPLIRIGAAARWVDEEKVPAFRFKSNTSIPNDEEYEKAVLEDIKRALEDASSRAASGKWQDSVYSSPAEKYDIATGDGKFSLTKEELVRFAQNRRSYDRAGISWGWMGHCHGWAPVSYIYREPKHAVLMKSKVTGSEVLFTEGDVRGMLTKTAAENGFIPGELFIGTRCNEEDQKVIKDRRGRIVDGVLGTWNEREGDFGPSKPIRIFINNWFNHSELGSKQIQLVFGFSPPYQKADRYWMKGLRKFPLGPGTAASREKLIDVEIYSTKQTADGEYVKEQLISSSVRSGDIGCIVRDTGECERAPSDAERSQATNKWTSMWIGLGTTIPKSSEPLAFKYYKTCRDMNAGAFHSILGRFVSEAAKAQGESHGFVMDITRSGEVWNHPIYAFGSKVGEKTPLDGLAIGDPFRVYRSPEAISVVDVYTQIIFGVENSPDIAYTPASNELSTKTFHYTLELDANDVVIGGEWHAIPDSDFKDLKPLSGEALFKELRRLSGRKSYHIDSETKTKVYHLEQDAPDFMWVYMMGSRLNPDAHRGSIIKADFVETLYRCSASTETENSVEFEARRTKYRVSYKKCEY